MDSEKNNAIRISDLEKISVINLADMLVVETLEGTNTIKFEDFLKAIGSSNSETSWIVATTILLV